MSPPDTPVHPRAAFQHRDFRFFQLARFVSIIAWQMESVAVGYLAYELTGDPLQLGYIGLAQFLPAIGFSLLTGHAADRFDRLRIVLACQATLVACGAGLCWFAWSGSRSMLLLNAIMFIIGTARAFQGPAGQALMPQLVPREHFPNAVAWNSSTWQIATIVGPGLGGLMYSVLGGAGPVYLTVALMTALATFLYTGIRHRSGRMEKQAASWETVLAGVRFVFARKIVLGSITLDLFAVLLGGATALMPIFAKDILKVDAWGAGLLRCAPGIGAAAMALAIPYLPPFKRAGWAMLWSVVAFGVCTIVFGLSRNFALSMTALVLLGAFDMISVIVRHVVVQMFTPPEMLGRVNAVNLVFIGASNELGEFESGVAASLLGTVPATVLGGVGSILVVALCALTFPELRRYRRLDQTHEE